MRIEKIQASKHKRGRILIFLENDTCLKITEQELLEFGLRSGDDIDSENLRHLQEAAHISDVKGKAAELIGRRPLSRRDLERKLREKGATEEEASDAAAWLEDIGALNDGDYAALLVRHYSAMGYGPARIREKFYEKGVPRDLWDAALEELPDSSGQIDLFLEKKLRDSVPDEKEQRRLTNALRRRGFSWEEIRAAWNRRTAE